MKRHLWYLSEELISLAFFSDDVEIEVKRKMITALQRQCVDNNRPSKKLADITNVMSKSLEDFVTCKSFSFFNFLNIDISLLEEDPSN